jgi:hypothetical protein
VPVAPPFADIAFCVRCATRADLATSPLRFRPGLAAELLREADDLDAPADGVPAELLDAFAYLPSYLGLDPSADLADALKVEEDLPVAVDLAFDTLSFFADALPYLPAYLGLTSLAFAESDLLAEPL